MNSFVHLHGHSSYSLGDATTDIEELVLKVKQSGMKAVALTDHGTMAGLAELIKEASRTSYKQKDNTYLEYDPIKPILGMEAYVAWDKADQDSPVSLENPTGHMILLAKNKTGYTNLCKLVEYSHVTGFWSKPRIDLEILAKHSEGLIGLSSCVSGIPQRCILGWNRFNKATGEREVQAPQLDILPDVVDLIHSIMGKGNYFLEVQNHRMTVEDYNKLSRSQKKDYDWLKEAQAEVFKRTLEVSKHTGCPMVVTNDFHYLSKSHSETRQAILAVGGKGLMVNRFEGDLRDNSIKEEHLNNREVTGQMYVKTPEEMAEISHYKDLPFLMHNTLAIEEMIEEINLSAPKNEDGLTVWSLPPIELGDHKSMFDMLKAKAYEGFSKRYDIENINKYPWMTQEHIDASKEQLDYELKIMQKLGLESYHLMVADYVQFAHDNGILVGPGRGSGAGSVVVYCLGITDLDPLRHGLLFERYLNPDRATAADLDIDFDPERVNEIHQYCIEKYGEEHVAKISTYSSVHAKGGVRKVARAMGLKPYWVNEISDRLPKDEGEFRTKLVDVISDSRSSAAAILRKFIDEGGNKARDLLRIAAKLDNVKISRSQHAAGIVISDKPLRGLVPLILHKPREMDTIATEYPHEHLENIGLLKQDLLVVDGLTTIKYATRYIREHTPDFCLPSEDKERYDSVEAYRVFANGDLAGIWQMSSPGMRELCMRFKPTTLSDIGAICALYRPGPLDYTDPETQMNMVEIYVKRKNGQLPVEYDHPLLENVLSETYGVLVFQEQIMELARVLCGWSYVEADYLRKAVGKKKPEEIAEQELKFIPTAIEHSNISAEIANKIWNQIKTFGRYGFNKSHSLAYGKLSYQMAYIKAKYPREFLAAAITVSTSKTSAVTKVGLLHDYIEEASRKNFEILLPDIILSKGNTVTEGKNKIRLGLKAVFGLAVSAERIAEADLKEEDSLGKVIDKIFKARVNISAVRNLMKAGAFDRYGTRASVSDFIERIDAARSRKNKANKAKLEEFFGLKTEEVLDETIPEFPAEVLMEQTFESLILACSDINPPSLKKIFIRVNEKSLHLIKEGCKPGSTELYLIVEGEKSVMLFSAGEVDDVLLLDTVVHHNLEVVYKV